MATKRTRAVKTFSLKNTTLKDLRTVAEESAIIGGMSAIVEDAASSWIKRYRADPAGWLSARGIAVHQEPTDDI